MTITSEEAKKALQANGLSIAQFAKTFGFNVHLVYAVLAGKNKASRGESHRIAVALGLKPKPSGEQGNAQGTAWHGVAGRAARSGLVLALGPG